MKSRSNLQSMTGFGSREAKIAHFGKVCVELKSINHKGLEIVFHLPEGFFSLEPLLKKEIEGSIKRGRINCVLTLMGSCPNRVYINRELLKEYIFSFKQLKQEFKINDGIDMGTLIHLPGVLSLVENKLYARKMWPNLKNLIRLAMRDLIKMRLKEGAALLRHLKSRSENVSSNLEGVKARFKKAIEEKLGKFKTDEERSAFLKNSDISEEIERLSFHVHNFQQTLLKRGPVGKELDFIAQEMQREANTMAAKSFDMVISGRVIQIKSQIEKIREQVQNIE